MPGRPGIRRDLVRRRSRRPSHPLSHAGELDRAPCRRRRRRHCSQRSSTPPKDRLGRGPLLDRLAGPSRAKLILIRAPAGWGKSTLMALWRVAEASRREFAWVTLDPRDSNPVRLWRYVIESLRLLAPEIGVRSLGLVGAPGVDLAAEMVPVLVDELSDLPAPLVVALDDYHPIEGDTVHATVRALLDHLPATVAIAIATRSEPPLPVARLRAHGQLVEVDARALQFSLQESRAFLNGQLGLELGDAEVLRLRAGGRAGAGARADLSHL